jgi:hypothetical protein
MDITISIPDELVVAIQHLVRQSATMGRRPEEFLTEEQRLSAYVLEQLDSICRSYGIGPYAPKLEDIAAQVPTDAAAGILLNELTPEALQAGIDMWDELSQLPPEQALPAFFEALKAGNAVVKPA